MVLFINTFIMNSSKYPRGNLKIQDRSDVFIYMLQSLSVIPWTRVIINYELDITFVERYKEINLLIKSLFPKATIKNKRNEYQSDWLISVTELETYKDSLIWFLCNDDHIFLDSNLDMLNALTNEIKQLYRENKYVTGGYSHWPEVINFYYDKSKIYENENVFVLKHNYPWVADSIQIITYELFEYWWTQNDYTGYWFPRTDPPHGVVKDKKIIQLISPSEIYSVFPKKELVRHLDAYSHIKPMVPFNVCSPLEIPIGFFANEIIIEYGFEKRTDESTTLINPSIPDYKVINSVGADQKIILKELPLFWNKHIKEIRIEKGISDDYLTYKRNLQMLKVIYWYPKKIIAINKIIDIFKPSFVDYEQFMPSFFDKQCIYIYAIKNNILYHIYSVYRFFNKVLRRTLKKPYKFLMRIINGE